MMGKENQTLSHLTALSAPPPPKKLLSIYKLHSPRTRRRRTVLAKGTVVRVAGLTAKRNDRQEAYAVRRQHLFALAKLSGHRS
jgi:hypothetical protein